MKKFSLLLILLFCWNVYSAWGYDVKVGGIYYNLDSDNHTASVTYASVSSYTGDVVVPEEISVNGTKYAVTSLGNYCFGGCTGLTSITIPSSVTSLGFGCFAGCSGIAYIKVDANNPVYDSRDNCNAIIETSTNEMIAGCKNSHIPSSVTSLGDECFHGCIGLEEITMLPTTVPYAGDYTFYETPLRTIYVANDEAKALYQAASPWNKYDIVSLNIEAGVSQISGSDTAPQVTGYYDLSGRLTGKQRGVVIERYADGTSRKVLVK